MFAKPVWMPVWMPVLALLCASATASAWTLSDTRVATDMAGDDALAQATAAWTTGLSPSAFPPSAVSQLAGAAACALGDVSGDGITDLALLVEAADGTLRLEARAGPDFQQVVWRLTTNLERLLTCAPDLDLDGTLDPIIRTIGETTGSAAAVAADQATTAIQQTLNGASGAAMVGRVVPQTVTSAGTMGAGAAQQAAAALLPAAEGAVGFLQASTSKASLPLPLEVPALPGLQQVTVVADATAKLQILDVTGAVVATVEVAQAGVVPIALAPVQLSGSLPDIAVLSQATTPLKEAAAGIPELALYAADGALAWSTQLPPSTGLPMLVPNAGDLDLDGVGDLIVTTVEQGVETAPGAAYTVLSGVDGSILFTSGPAVSGLLAALPLGDLGGGAMLLEASMAEGAASLALSVLDGTGNVEWTATVPALAKPVNHVLDPYTHDLLGFTDLTGDGLPDVAVSVAAAANAGALDVQVLDGLTGEVAWATSLPDVQHAMAVVIGTAQLLEGAAGAAREGAQQAVNQSTEVADLAFLQGKADQVTDAAVGAASAVLAYGTTSANATLALLDGFTGEVVWTAVAQLPATLPDAHLSIQAAGDLDGDDVQDLLVTAHGAAAEEPATQPPATGSAEPEDGPQVVAAVSGADGETVWTTTTSEQGAGPGDGLEFESDAPRLQADEADGSGSNGIPSPAAGLLLAALVAVAGLLRRRP